MKCPFCQKDETRVTDKRLSGEAIRRRRECVSCGNRFTTYEKLEPLERFVVKKDGRREAFNRDKLFLGIIKACEKRNIGHDEVNNIVNEIEKKLFAKKKEIEAGKIGEMVMKKLKRLDKVAYIRFASVYRDFHDIDDFKKEVEEL